MDSVFLKFDPRQPRDKGGKRSKVLGAGGEPAEGYLAGHATRSATQSPDDVRLAPGGHPADNVVADQAGRIVLGVDPPDPFADPIDWVAFAEGLKDIGMNPQDVDVDWPAGFFERVYLTKYSPTQRRGADGKWTAGGGGGNTAGQQVVGGGGGVAPAGGDVTPGTTGVVNGITVRITGSVSPKDAAIANKSIAALDPNFLKAAAPHSVTFSTKDCGTAIGLPPSGPGTAGLTDRASLKIAVKTGIGMNPGPVATHELGHSYLTTLKKTIPHKPGDSTVEVTLGKGFTAAHAADKAALSPAQNATFHYYRNREEAAVESMSYALQSHGAHRSGFRAAFPQTDAYVRKHLADKGFKTYD